MVSSLSLDGVLYTGYTPVVNIPHVPSAGTLDQRHLALFHEFSCGFACTCEPPKKKKDSRLLSLRNVMTIIMCLAWFTHNTGCCAPYRLGEKCLFQQIGRFIHWVHPGGQHPTRAFCWHIGATSLHTNVSLFSPICAP